METVIGNDIQHAIDLLKKNELVAIPTETVYGLAGNALSESALLKIFEAKKRPRFNPVIMHVKSIEAIDEYAVLNEEISALLRLFMPGPFTVLLPKKKNVPDLLTAGSDKVAIRIPNHPITKQLLEPLDFPLAAPSANPFGYISPVTAEHVLEGLNGKIHYILDGGTCAIGIESTIAEPAGDKLLIRRLGGLSIEAIQEKTDLLVQLVNKQDKPQTSGQMKSHYAPNTPLYVGEIKELLAEHRDKKTAVISYSKDYDKELITTYHLSANRDMNEAAANLFKVLRLIDKENYEVILAEQFPEDGLGKAINDRLSRAQAEFKE
ncbi:MAG: Threonylcarbamoyl-AMP synthase [Chitinophagaceae bacterium]|nr:Threonylcarbamoyl-AMP synthase [Chitinophagaceae bacterium]